MKLMKIKYVEDGTQTKNCVNVELDPKKLAVDEFAQLRHLIDESSIMNHENHMEGSPPGDYTSIFTIETTDGEVHKAIFSDTELPGEYLELADYIKELGHVAYAFNTLNDYLGIR